MDTKLVRRSKFLSLLLRHRPDEVGLELDPEGWVSVPELLARVAAHPAGFDRPTLEEIVATNAKNRFELDLGRDRIRARQGHSLSVDIGLEPTTPPAELYHGTAERNLPSILRSGLEKRSRQHVHLSADVETARQVGLRHGKPVILRVASGRLQATGQPFFRSTNGVWLTESVSPEFLEVVAPGGGVPG